MSVAPGTLIAGKYRVERVIGEGGMGIVVAARHIELGRRVAVKLVRRDAIAAGSIDRLLREARAAASIENPHVARVLDVGRTVAGEPFLVLEHLHGEDLHARLARGVVSVSDAVRWILEACEGLAAAHASGLVHRDLKPGNLFLAKQADGRETIKLLDFGLAKSVKSDDGRITATGAILGSPSYMSPEHLSDRPLDARSDVWSLGVTLFELLANVLPFSGRTTPEICAAVLSSPPASLTQHREDVPPALEAVVMACLEKDPALRPTDVAQLASRLEPFADGVTGAASRVARTLAHVPIERPLDDFDASVHEAPTHLVSAIDALPRERRIPLVAAVAIALASLVGIGIGVVVAVRGGSSPTASSASTIVSVAAEAAKATVSSAQALETPVSAPTATADGSMRPRTPPRLRPAASHAPSAKPHDPLERF